MKYIYLGGFPPPYGGVTIKNKLLFNKLSDFIEIEQSNLYIEKSNLPMKMISIFISLFSKKNGLIIGISKGSLKKVTYLLYRINKKLMNKSIVMVMGGTFSELVVKEPKLQKRIKEYKHIYVETNSMKEVLNSVGVINVSVYPNCRERPKKDYKPIEINEEIKCVFFSLISKDKGVEIILNAARILKEKGIKFSIDFFGHIDPKYKDQFEKGISLYENIHYCGVFKSIGQDDVYDKLHRYDVLLFPSMWKNEGVPGILVEAKIAGVPAIASNINYNSEIITDGKTGLILKENTPVELADAIERLYLNRDMLIKMKNNAKYSSKYFLIEYHVDNIVKMIKK
jgi:glycosyltransferase involved in cell wall biosynthesis